MLSRMGETLQTFMIGMMVILIVSVPLALWKVIDIVIWIYRNVSISWGG